MVPSDRSFGRQNKPARPARPALITVHSDPSRSRQTIFCGVRMDGSCGVPITCLYCQRFQANLSHNSECTAGAVVLRQNERISDDILEGECMADIREWALRKKQKTDVYRLIERRYAPLKLREDGQRKVGDTADCTCDVEARQ